MNRIVVEPLKVDLIRARERPVADKTDNLGAECGGLIKPQYASGRGESDGCGIGSCEFKRGALRLMRRRAADDLQHGAQRSV
jgi:hypothetical protein